MTAESPATAPGTRPQRQSNFELLRIISMMMVLGVHADFLVLGVPNAAEIEQHPLPEITRTVIESLCIVCVNVFVMISGWFSIRPSVRGFSNFLFQVIYYTAGVYLVALAIGHTTLSADGILMCLGFRRLNWFVAAYAGLYLMSPVLNSFLERCGRRTLLRVLIAFYLLQILYGWFGQARYFECGYSAFSFIGLYLLARWLRLYGAAYSRYGLAIYLGATACTAGLFIALQFAGGDSNAAISYASPFVVAGAAGMILWCSRWPSGSVKAINFMAKSAFAVFLLHVNYYVMPGLFRPIVTWVYDGFSGAFCLLMMLLALCAIYVATVIIDQPRQWLWQLISRIFTRKFNNHDTRPSYISR